MSDLNNDIINYHNGKLTPEQMHALERKALDDPFLAEALEGSSQISPATFTEDLMVLSSRLNKEIHKTPADKVPPSMWTWPLRIAAGLVIFISATVVFFALRFEKSSNEIALNEEVHAPLPKQASPPKASTSDDLEKDASEPTKGDVAKPLAKSIPGVKTPPAEAPKDVENIVSSDELATNSSLADEPVTKNESDQIRAEQQLAQAAPAETEVSPALKAPASTLSKAKLKSANSDSLNLRESSKFSDRAKKSEDRLAERKQAASDKTDGYASGSALNNQIIKGQVFDMTGTGLPGVNVLIKGTEIGTVTDATGSYEITAEKKDPTLVYSFIGYSSHEVEVSGKKEINISLDEDVSQLSEVVVTGYGIQKDDADITVPLELAAPEGGRRAYKQYLEKNLRYPEQALGKSVEGKVTIQFAVEPSGELADFRVIKGIGDGCDEEVIRLIKSGPKWNPTKRDTEKLRGTVRVKMRFQLPKRK